MADTLHDILRNELCHGCGGCAAAVPGRAISMRLTADGYLRPAANRELTRDDQAIVRQVCSGRELRHRRTEGTYHPLWGPLLEVRLGHATDEEVRFQGSSGGVISAVSIYLLEARLVDFIVHVSADLCDPFGNAVRPSRTREDVLAAAGSRYAPSATLSDLDSYLATGATFAVIGKPCDIASLRRMALRDPRIDKQVPIKIAFMCAGVPSRHGAVEVAKQMGAGEEQVQAFAFRGEGWPGFARAKLHSGRVVKMDYATSWGKILNRHLQFRCKICPDGTGEFADLVCADAWHGPAGYPDFDERPGRSLVLSRTRMGETIIRDCISAGSLATELLSHNKIEIMQPYQAERKRMVLARIFGMVAAGSSAPTFRALRLVRLTLSSRPNKIARNILGTFRRIQRNTR